METAWITKEEICQVAPNSNCNSSNEMFNDGQLGGQQLTAYGVDEYCQDLDNLVFCLDDFFVPGIGHQENGSKKSTQEQHKILTGLLTSEPIMTPLNVKTECMDQQLFAGWTNACQSPDSGVHVDPALSPNSDYDSNCSVSPGMTDLESPGSVASSFSATSTDSGIFLGGNGQNEVGFEIYHDLIMRHLVQDIKATCIRLNISQDPKLWTPTDSRAWLTDMSAQYHLTQVPYEKLNVNGTALCSMSLAQFNQCFPNGGETVHAQLQIWNSANEYCKRQSGVQCQKSMITTDSINMNHFGQNMVPQSYKMVDDDMPAYMATQFANSFHIQQQQNQYGHMNQSTYSLSALLPSPGSCSDSGLSLELDQTGESTKTTEITTNHSNNIHLWQFLRELLDQGEKFSHCVRWVDHSAGIFKIEDSHKLARLWGQRKNRPAMNYDKLSRSLRQYYKKNILKKTTRSQRLVYQFMHPYHMC